MAGFIPNPAGLAELLQSPTGAVGIYISALTKSVEELAQATCPTVSGSLRDSIQSIVTSPPIRGEVRAGGDSAPYVLAVHEGSLPHEILPVNAPMLVFPDRVTGVLQYRLRVWHPGTKYPQPFLWDSLKTVIAAKA